MNKRSISAVVVGVLFIIVASTVVDVVLHALGTLPPLDQRITDAEAALALSYRIAISVAGAWITARIAPDKPVKHALILGAVGTVLGLVGVITTWNLGLGPHWYPVALAVLAIPQCWAGGKIAEQQLARAA